MPQAGAIVFKLDEGTLTFDIRTGAKCTADELSTRKGYVYIDARFYPWASDDSFRRMFCECEVARFCPQFAQKPWLAIKCLQNPLGYRLGENVMTIHFDPVIGRRHHPFMIEIPRRREQWVTCPAEMAKQIKLIADEVEKLSKETRWSED